MTRDRVEATLLEALKQARLEAGEQRLFRSGKLPGLFAARTGASGEAAARALRDGLLEVSRSEVRGKTVIEWVRLTPRGVERVAQHESPVEVLRELRALLQASRDGVPDWLSQVRREVDLLGQRLAQDVARILQRLEAIHQRVEEALRRADILTPPLDDDLAAALPWGQDALDYLDRRRASGTAGDCPLPELFAAIRQKQPALNLASFHDGLRRLQDRHALRLLPWPDPAQPLPQPEFALLDGPQVLYFAVR